MKIEQYKFLLVLLAFGLLTACDDKDSEGVSRTTYYPVITLNGDPELFVMAGSNYTEPGGIAKEAGEDVPLDIKYNGIYFGASSSTLNTSLADAYNVSYTAVNKDGFPGTKTRTVYVAGQGDLVNDISGIYTATVKRNGSTGPQYTDMEYVIVAKTGDNTYRLSDGIGGYYDFGRGYGSGYAAPSTTITANDISGNDFTFGGTFPVRSFGGTAEIQSMQVNAAAKTISFVTVWDTGTTVYTFEVTLKQVEF